MEIQSWFDSVPIFWVFVFSTLMMVLFIEVGFRLAQRLPNKPHKTQMAQVRAIMGASLGLLAFMLAFSFSIAQSHYEERAAAYMLEMNAVNSAYRSAAMLGEEHEFAARDLIRQFVDSRVDTIRLVEEDRLSEAGQLIEDSKLIQDRLWEIAEASERPGTNAESAGLFVSSILAMIEAGQQRLQATIYNRLSAVIWFALMVLALLSMVVMGYQAGLTGTRSQLATWTLALTFSIVMALVTDLDRPRMSLFQINQDILYEYQEAIHRHLGTYSVEGRE